MNDFLLLHTHTSVLTVVVLLLTVFVSACSEDEMNLEIVLVAEGDYMYPAKVEKPSGESDTHIQVYIFNDTLREKVGDKIPRNKVAVDRPKPPKGWGTRQVALEYFRNQEWIYTEDATEFEDHYRIPTDIGEKEKLKLNTFGFQSLSNVDTIS